MFFKGFFFQTCAIHRHLFVPQPIKYCHILFHVTDLKKREHKYAQLIKRFIDDLIWLSYGSELTEKINQALTNTCMGVRIKTYF